MTQMGLVSPAAESRNPGLHLQTQAATDRDTLFHVRKHQTLLETELSDYYHVIFAKYRAKAT